MHIESILGELNALLTAIFKSQRLLAFLVFNLVHLLNYGYFNQVSIWSRLGIEPECTNTSSNTTAGVLITP